MKIEEGIKPILYESQAEKERGDKEEEEVRRPVRRASENGPVAADIDELETLNTSSREESYKHVFNQSRKCRKSTRMLSLDLVIKS